MSDMEIKTDGKLVARCGLYCGACRAYLKKRCKGCAENAKATWCKVRTCCNDNKYALCAECKEFSQPMNCRKFNNIVSKIFGLLFRSDRAACIAMIREVGVDGYAKKMAADKKQTIKRV